MTSEETQFIFAHLHDDPARLLLAMSGRQLPFPLRDAVTQIECRRRCASKLPGFLSNCDFRFADTLSAEQATHEAVARYHASLVAPATRVLDMTAGLGIDSLTLAAAGCRVTACELDPRRAATLADNARTLALPLRIENADSATMLTDTPTFDLIFIDPARRDSAGRRTYGFADCTPDILTLLPRMLLTAPRLLIKASPLLDVTLVRRQIPPATRIFAVSHAGECKELLIEVETGGTLKELKAIDITRDGAINDFTVAPGAMSTAPAGALLTPGAYLYEPSPSLMKLAPWGALCERYPDLRKLDASTHLFASHVCYPDFPGRIVRIESFPDSRAMKALRGESLNIVSRNYPLTPEQLRKKYALRDAPDATRFLYALRHAGKPRLVVGGVFRF